MLHFYKFSAESPAPAPARGTYMKRSPGKGWPEECPPLRAANAFGWDVLAAHEMTFRKKKGAWRLVNPVDVESDWVFHAEDEESSQGAPLTQRNAWFWEEDQVLPHTITRDVFPHLADQVKVSTFLFLHTDANELIYMTDVPNRRRPYKVVSALVDTDWYPASYPWHCVLELDPTAEEVHIAKDEPFCRVFLVRRDHYFAREMSVEEFERYFSRTQTWLSRHGKGEKEGSVDITGAYVKQQQLSRFSVTI